eukprot:05002_3
MIQARLINGVNFRLEWQKNSQFKECEEPCTSTAEKAHFFCVFFDAFFCAFFFHASLLPRGVRRAWCSSNGSIPGQRAGRVHQY